MNKFIYLLFHNPNRLLAWLWSKVGHAFSDETYLKVRYRLLMGRKLDLQTPKTFNEKLQWLKLYDKKPEYTTMVDKYAVKGYVSSIIGAEYIIPTLGVWNRPEEIDFESLPEQFVLKTTNGGGSLGVIVCKSKAQFDKERAIQLLNDNMNDDWRIGMEWPYKDVTSRIIAEEYLAPDTESDDLYDYKFFCFNGKVKCFKIDFNRQIEHHANYYDATGQLLPFGEVICSPQYERHLPIPSSLPVMISLAERLSEGHLFLRVDFYHNKDRIYFGEITFFPASGTGRFDPDEWDKRLGDWLILPKVN